MLEHVIKLLSCRAGGVYVDTTLGGGGYARAILEASAPDGILLARNASDDLHVEKGHELFRVADLTQVWVLADVSGWEADYLKPGSEVRLSIPRRSQTYKGIVSRALPLIDAESRTLKLRIETHKSGVRLEAGHVRRCRVPP